MPRNWVLSGGTSWRSRTAIYICLVLAKKATGIWEQHLASPKWPCNTSLRYSIFWRGAWRAISAINTSPHYGLMQFPGCKADFVPPLLCKWDTKTLPGSSKAKGLPVNCKSHFCVLGWSAAPSNPFPICWDLFLHFLFRQCILAHIGFHSLLHNCFVHTSISLLIVLLVASTVLKYIWRKPQKKVTAHYMDCFDILISLCLSIVLENEGQWWEPISVKCYLCSFNNAMGTLGCIH